MGASLVGHTGIIHNGCLIFPISITCFIVVSRTPEEKMSGLCKPLYLYTLAGTAHNHWIEMPDPHYIHEPHMSFCTVLYRFIQ